MAMLYTSERGERLINVLLTQSDYVSLQELAGALDVSRRTVYYDINKINIWLEQIAVPGLEIIRDKGVFLPYEYRDIIRENIDMHSRESVYIFSPAERCKGIICYIVYSDKPLYIEQLAECFEVSRNTILNDLKAVNRQLKQYGLRLDYQSKTGYGVKGDAICIRAVFMLYFSELETLFKGNKLHFFEPESVKGYYEKLLGIERESGVVYVEGVLFSIAVLIPLLYRHQHPVQFPGLKASQIRQTREYELINRYFDDLNVDERCYLALHLLGSRVNTVPDRFFTNPSKQYIRDIVNELITEFEKTACVFFEEKDELEKALFIHLSTSLYRYQYGIQIGNTIADDVIKEYPDLFAITKKVIKRFEMSIGVPIPDAETAYLVLHFGSALKISGRDNQRLRILIVCVNGISAGNMIKREVQKLLPFAQIAGVRAVPGLVNAQEICDVIISTVKINSVVPDIVVNPVLTALDRKNILNHRLIAPKKIEIRRDQIFRIVKKYVSPEDYVNLQNDLTVYLQGGLQEFHIEDKMELGLCKMLDPARINIVSESCSWEQGIRIAGQCLIDSNSIEPGYLDTIISQIHNYGPYMFLNDSVMLAHAKPEDGVNSLDVSITLFKEPVIFSKESKARLIIVLAAEDQEKHLRILQDILELVSEGDSLNALMESDSSEELLAIINNR
mgnify:CR=1 FL=1